MGQQRAQVVLAVDDFNLFSASIRQTLLSRGFEVLCASSPANGFALFQAHRSKIGMVLLDVAPPSASNLDLAAELVRLRPGLPILYLVGPDKSIARCSIEARAPESVLITPFTGEQLIQRVGGLLTLEAADRRPPQEQQGERLIADSDPIRSGPAILHVYELRQAALAADHIAILDAGNIHHSVRPTNCDAAPYGMVVPAKDVALARVLLAQASARAPMVSAA
jgi:DNA-binding response OmpR family regulator